MKKDAWKIRRLVDEFFVSMSQRTSVSYCRLSDFEIAFSESEKSNLGQRYDNDNDVIHVSSRRLALCPHTLHWVAFEKNGVDTETVPPFSFWRHDGIKSWKTR